MIAREREREERGWEGRHNQKQTTSVSFDRNYIDACNISIRIVVKQYNMNIRAAVLSYFTPVWYMVSHRAPGVNMNMNCRGEGMCVYTCTVGLGGRDDARSVLTLP